MCNTRLDEFDYYDAVESGRISPEDTVDHSEAILICPLDEAVETVWSKSEEIPLDDLIWLHGEGDTVQYLGERNGKLRFSAFIDAMNEEKVYELPAPDLLDEITVVD